MKKTKSLIGRTLVIILSLATLNGCEGMRCADGSIFDNDTGEPIDSVFCKVLTGTEEVYSDNTGYYSLCNDFGGCVPDCKDIIIEYSKPGYITKELTNPNRDDVYLERE